MNIRADEKPDGEFIEFGLHPSAKRHPLAFGPIAIYLGIEHYTEENAQECQRRAKAFFKVFDDMGKPLLHKADGTPFTAENIDETFIRHHLGQRPGFERRTNEDFDEHVAHVRARRTADA
ncbi:hypothetical protein [Streptomyces sp. NPDC059080]|uniref:hypothetical protein n=1 Tax=Streptomyces sp. NPDC059080 TaxID=3346718 RepID=UPI003696820E